MAGRGRQTTAGEKTGHRKDPGDIEPLSARLVPVEDALAMTPAPEDLGPEAADAWRVWLTEMAGNRHVRQADLYELRVLCMWVHVLEEAWKSVNESGTKVRIEGKIRRNPDLLTMKEASTQVRYYTDFLGLTPLARIRQNLADVVTAAGILDVRERLVADLGGG